MKFTYLLIDFFSVLVPFIFSFHPRLKFYKRWFAVFPAMVVTGVIFVTWDMYFTQLKVWGFNPDYLTGVTVGNLPVEEVLFFLCIPYSCVFTYTCLHLIIKISISNQLQGIISSLLIVLAVFMAIFFHHHIYTISTFILLAILLVTSQFIIKASWLSRFYIAYLILLLPFFIVNGLLTGTGLSAPVVWYNQAQIINLHILTIPVEDIFYGMDMILLNIIIYSMLTDSIYRKRKNSRRLLAYSKNLTYYKSSIIS